MVQLLQNYHPNPPPSDMSQVADISRYLDDELNRIAVLLEHTNPNFGYTIATYSDTLIPVDSIPTWTNLFDGSTQVVDIPDGQFDPVTGVWTCFADGIYMVSASFKANIPAGIGNRDFVAGLRFVVNGTPGTEWISSGSDEFPLTVSATETVPIDLNDTLVVEGALYTSNPAGDTADVAARLNIWRLG